MRRTLPVIRAYLLAFAVLLLGTAPVTGQSLDALLTERIKQLDHATTTGRVPELQTARAELERLTKADTLEAFSNYYVGLASYRLANRDTDRKESYLDDAEKHLQRALQNRPDWAEAQAVLSAVYGQKAADGMISGMRFGPKADAALEAARASAPQNPRVLLMEGISLYHKPGRWGGDKKKAVQRLKAAIDAFEPAPADTTASLEPTWGHAESYAWLGIAHAEADRREAARRAFETALEIRPGYAWVEEVLLPKLAAQ